MPAVGGVRAGPMAGRAAPSGAGPKGLRDRARPQPRSAFRGAAGCPRSKGSPETKQRLRRRGRLSPEIAADRRRYDPSAAAGSSQRDRCNLREIRSGTDRWTPTGSVAECTVPGVLVPLSPAVRVGNACSFKASPGRGPDRSIIYTMNEILEATQGTGTRRLYPRLPPVP